MQALSEEESALVRAHVMECEACRAELAALAGDLALVALSVEQQPLPQGARERFMERIAADAQSHSPLARVLPFDLRLARKVAVWAPRAAVAALLIIAVGLTWEVKRLDEHLRAETQKSARLAQASARAQEVLNVLTAPAAQRVLLTAAKTPPAPTGRAVYLPASGGLIFQANNLASLPEAKAYELWVIPANGSAPVPAGVFRPDASGNASVVLPPLPRGVAAKAFGVTIEKASGSDTPTVPLVLAGAAPAPGD
jgi:anti-sigma-K factor RskA